MDDDLTVQTLVQESLPDFRVVSARSLAEAEKFLAEGNFVAVLLDIQLPDGDGLRFAARLAQQNKLNDIPLLILSNYADTTNKVMAFELGAEDFIGKPFDPLELHARLKAKLRRLTKLSEEKNLREVGDLLLDFDRHKAFWLGKGSELDLQLTGIELKILSLVTRRLEQVYSRDQIIDQVWGQTHISDRTVDSHVAHLRQKISPTSLQIETVKSLGYRAVLAKKKAPLA